MADILVRLSINENRDSKAIGSVVINNPNATNNISLGSNTSGELENNYNTAFLGSEVLSFGSEGVLYFNSSGYLANSKNNIAGNLQDANNPRAYYFGVTNENGEYEITLTIIKDVNSVDLDSIVIVGDEIAEQYPIEAYIDGAETPITNTNTTWNIFFDKLQATHTIRFTKWNRENYNAILTHIRVMFKYIDIINNLNNLSSIAQTTPDARELNYGVIANTGKMEVIDTNGEIKQLITDGILSKSNVPIDVIVNGETIQKHISDDSDYNTADNTFSVYLTNQLNSLDILKYKGLSYPETEMSLYEILKDVMKTLLGSSFTENYLNQMLSNYCVYKYNDMILEFKISSYLQSIKVKYPMIEYGKTYREVLNEICTIAQLRLFINKYNQYEFVSARPLLLLNDDPYRITKDFVMDDIKTDVIIRNKYDGIEMSETQVIDNINYNTNVFSIKEEIVLNELKGEFDKNESPNLNENLDFSMSIDMENSNYYKKNYVSSGSLGNNYFGYIYEKNYYEDWYIVIPKRSNYNLEKILKIDEKIYNKDDLGNKNFNYTLSYKKLTWDNATISFEDIGKENIKITNLNSNDSPKIEELSGLFNTYYNSTQDIVSIDLNNNSYINITGETENDFLVHLHILVGQEKARNIDIEVPILSTKVTLKSEFIKIIPNQIEFSVYGNKRVISFEQISANSDNIEKAKTKAKVQTTGNLLQTTTYLDDNSKTKMSDIIKENILNDYKDGISTMSMQIACGDFTSRSTLKTKKFNNGDLLSVNDTIFLTGDKYEDGTDRNWRIFSDELVYDGEPLINIICNEVKKY